MCVLRGDSLLSPNEDTKKQLKDISPGRLGGWQPGEAPSPQLLTLVSSRIKLMKSKQLIREDDNPVVPSLLVDRLEWFDEEEERVRTKTLARCWRCQSRCRFWLHFRIPRNFGPPHLHVSGGSEDRGITQ